MHSAYLAVIAPTPLTSIDSGEFLRPDVDSGKDHLRSATSERSHGDGLLVFGVQHRFLAAGNRGRVDAQ